MEKGGNGLSRRIITVAGCKGGVGKSVIACALAIEVGKQGKTVVLVDADLGGPNLHTYLGIQAPKYVISDFLSRRFKSIDEILMDTEHANVRFISSAGNVPSQANIKFAQKVKIIDGIRSLKADLIIIDIGAGSSYDVMDFFSMTDDGILVTTPEPTSIVNSYGFVKNVVYRKFSTEFKAYPLVSELLKRGMNPSINGGITAMQELMGEMATVSPECWFKARTVLERFAPNIIVNMVTSESDSKLGEKLKTIISKYLSVDARCLGDVVEDPAVRASARRMTPFVKLAPNCKAAQCVRQILQRLNFAAANLEPTPQDAPLTWERA
jgi:flagellar biosynthesis protein FlhG